MKKAVMTILGVSLLLIGCKDKRLSEMPWHQENFATAQQVASGDQAVMMFFRTEW